MLCPERFGFALSKDEPANEGGHKAGAPGEDAPHTKSDESKGEPSPNVEGLYRRLITVTVTLPQPGLQYPAAVERQCGDHVEHRQCDIDDAQPEQASHYNGW